MSISGIIMIWLSITIVAGLFGMLDFIIGYHTILYYVPVSYLFNKFTDFNGGLIMLSSLTVSLLIGIIIRKHDEIFELKSNLFKKEWYESVISYGIFISFLIFLLVK